MRNTIFQKNLIIFDKQQLINEELNKEIKNIKNENIKLKNKIDGLKKDLTIGLECNDSYNLELRKLKLYNYLFKTIGFTSILLNIYCFKYR